jgi:hypothetical protein
MLLPTNIQNAPFNVPISINYTVEFKSYLEEKDVLNIEKLLDKHTKSFITFDTQNQFPFSSRINDLKKLEGNWDNYGGYSPNGEIVNKVEDFLKVLPKKYAALLDDDDIFPNPHGTVTIEWRKNNSVVSIEFGLSTSSFYSIVNNQTDSEEHLESILSSNKLVNAFNKIIA